MKLTWQDVDDIALDLVERYPQVDPLSVKFPDLKTMVTSLPSFGGQPRRGNRCNTGIDPVCMVRRVRGLTGATDPPTGDAGATISALMFNRILAIITRDDRPVRP